MSLRARQFGSAVLFIGMMLAVSFSPAHSVELADDVARAETASVGRDESSEGKTFWQRTITEPVSFFTLWIAAFTGALVLLTFTTARQHAREMKVIQRAYVAVEPSGVEMVKEPADHAIASIQVSNAGRLPARGLRWVIECKFSDEFRLRDLPIPANVPEWGSVLPPGSVMIQGSPLFDAEEMKTSPRNKYLYVWGAVFYEDGFGRLRTTSFCHRYNCVNFRGKRIRPHFGRFHRYGNEAD